MSNLNIFVHRREINRKKGILGYLFTNRYIYFLVLPGLLFYMIFAYLPMYGIIIAFKDYMYNKGILGSPWIGFDNFRYMFNQPAFYRALRNTLLISLGRIVFEFPAPIIIALLLNELRKKRIKRFLQTVYTFPHFLSWVVVAGMAFTLFSSIGTINTIMLSLGRDKVNILGDPTNFIILIFASSIWKSAGWGSIIYLASLSSINPEMYEAAIVDGAGRFKQFIYVTWPGILPTVVTLLILSAGNVMNGGGGGVSSQAFDQIFNLYNPLVLNVADIIDTYIYRITFVDSGNFSFSAAVGIFKSVVNCILLISVNRLAKSMGQRGIY